MPKKAGKKGGGGEEEKPMTEEERLVLLQQKAQAEEQKAKIKQDLFTQFLKDKLQKEEQNTKVNLLKLNQQWRSTLCKAGAEELRQDFATLSQTFERVVDCKDNVIKLLVCDLIEAEQQSTQAQETHLQLMDDLLEVHKSRLAELESHWNTSVGELCTEYNTERAQILKQNQQKTEYLQAATFALDQHYAGIDSEAQQEYQSTCDDIKKQNIEEKQALRTQVESTVEQLSQKFQQEQQKYTKATQNQQIVFDSLRTAEKHNAREAGLQMKHMQKLQGNINALRSHLSASQKVNEACLGVLRAECDELTNKVQQLRAKLNSAQATEKTQLANHTMYSYNAIKKLQELTEKGESLLRLADVCRKLETEQEKVLPFYTSLNAEELTQEKAHATEVMTEVLAETMMSPDTDLEHFWQRYNKVLLERLCLQREKKVLGWENRQLRILLKQYLDDSSVSDEILQQQNSLLLLSCPSLQASPASETQTHRTVIEAAHVVQRTL